MRLESTSADRFNTVLMAQFRPDIHKLGAFLLKFFYSFLLLLLLGCTDMNTKWLPICVTLWMAMASIGMAEFLRDCHATDPKPYIHYATKTPYELINNEDSSPIFVAGKF